jgi:glycine cleavage system H protein
MDQENYPTDLGYHPEHAWVRIEGEIATVGISWFAQDRLREIVFFDPPRVGDRMTKDQPFAGIESVKAYSDVCAPVSGDVVEVNTALAGGVGAVNQDPYGRGWLVRVRLSDPGEAAALLSAEEYGAMVEA